MKKILVLFVAVLTGAFIARADGSLGVMGSYWEPKGFENNLGFGGKLLLGGQNFGLEARGSYFENLKQKADAGNLALRVVPVDVGLVLRASGQQLIPYFGGGGSYYFLEGKSNSGFYSVDDEFGWYATGGLELPLSTGTSIFVEALYRKVTGTAQGSSLNHTTSNVNIDLSGLVVNIGLSIRF